MGVELALWTLVVLVWLLGAMVVSLWMEKEAPKVGALVSIFWPLMTVAVLLMDFAKRCGLWPASTPTEEPQDG